MLNILVVSNPLAGGGVAVEVMEMYRRYADEQTNANYHFYLTQNARDVEGISAAVECYKPDVVSIVGGDGTVNEVINVDNVRDKKIHVVPAGSGNDFFRQVYGDMSIAESFKLSQSSQTKAFDFGKCNDRYFANAVGIGFDGNIARQSVRMKFSFIPSKWKYWIVILRNILFYKSTEVELQYNGKTERKNIFLVDVANGRECGGGFRISPESDPTDGEFELIGISNVSHVKRIAKLMSVKNGNHLNDPAVFHEKVTQVTIKSDKTLHAHLDGEILSNNEFEISLVGKLTVCV